MWALSLSGLLNSLVQPTCVLVTATPLSVRTQKYKVKDVPLQRASPEGTLVFLEGLVDEHVPLHLVLPVEGGVAERALVWLFSCKQVELSPFEASTRRNRPTGAASSHLSGCERAV